MRGFVPVGQLQARPPLAIGLSGMSNSGKTYSALLIAKAIAASRDGGPVCFIDTEAGRIADYESAHLYPELHPFTAMVLDPPFEGARVAQAIDIAVKNNAGCIILDSASDEWEGEGGVLQSQEAMLSTMAGQDVIKRDRMNMAAWAKAKKPHQVFHAKLIGLPVPLIMCFRARPKIKMMRDQNGRTQIVDAGVQPICDSRIIYDLKFHLLMDEERRDGSYRTLKGGYKHERHVFPGGMIDADTIQRLIAVLPKQRQQLAVQASLEWTLDQNSMRLECAGDAGTMAAKRTLFSKLLELLNPTNQEEEHRAKRIIAVNHALVDSLPEAGRTRIDELIQGIRHTPDEHWEQPYE